MTENFDIDKSVVRYMKTNRSVLCEAIWVLTYTLFIASHSIEQYQEPWPLFIEESVFRDFYRILGLLDFIYFPENHEIIL